MENINPTLELTFCLQQATLSGHGFKWGLTQYLEKSKAHDPLAQAAVQLLSQRQLGEFKIAGSTLSPYQISLLELLRRGLNGESVGPHLQQLREEIERSLQREIERHVCLVPFWSFLPLVIFQLPALLLIAVYPLLRNLLEQLNSSS